MTENPKWARARRRKSSRSNGGTNGQCVEVLHADGKFGLSDTKLGDETPILEVDADAFHAFVSEFKSPQIP
jgi:hypothetical protein